MCKTEQWNSQRVHGQPTEQDLFAHAARVWLTVDHNTSVFLANEFDVLRVLHGQVSLAAVNQMFVI